VRDARQQRKSQQHVGERISRQLEERRELQTTARFDVAESVLLREAYVAAELEQVIPVNVARVVQDLVDVGDAVLRVVAFVAERRETSDRD